MRKLIVLLILVIFILYCVQANRCQTWYEMPAYEKVTVDILDGMTTEEWAQLPEQARRDRLAALASRRLTLLGDAPNGRVLASKDYEDFLASGVSKFKAKDPAELTAFINLRLRLRQDVKLIDGTVIGKEGREIDQEFLDAYISAAAKGTLAQESGHENQVAMVGAGQVVGFNATILMVMLIFVGMALVLEKIFWQPMMAFIDERTGEIRKGMECSRSNKNEAERIDREYRESLRRLNRECQKRLREERQKTFEHADLIMSKAWQEMKDMRESVQEEIATAIIQAEKELRAEIPAMAEAISVQLKKKS